MKIVSGSDGDYWVEFAGEGGVKRLPTYCDNLEDARVKVKKARIFEIEMAHQAGVLNKIAINLALTGKKKNVAELIGEFLQWKASIRQSKNTIANADFMLRAFARDTGTAGLMPQELNESHVDAYVNKDDGSMLATRKVRGAHLSSFFNWLEVKGYISGNPAKLVRVDLSAMPMSKKERRHFPLFTDQDLDALLKAAAEISRAKPKQMGASWDPDFWRYAILLGRYAGLRIGDVAQMEWSSWKDAGSILVVWTQKRGKRIELPLDSMGPGKAKLQEAYSIVVDRAAMLLSGESQYVGTPRHIFPKQALMHMHPLERARLPGQFRCLARRAKIGRGKTFHCLRRTFVTDAARRGIPMDHIAVQVGHSSVGMTEKYVVGPIGGHSTTTTNRKFA